MPERTFTNWLQNLYDLLTPDGVLMFSVHDECLRAPHVEMPAKGILFSANSESQSLDKEEYGTTYVTEKFVREIVDRKLAQAKLLSTASKKVYAGFRICILSQIS